MIIMQQHCPSVLSSWHQMRFCPQTCNKYILSLYTLITIALLCVYETHALSARKKLSLLVYSPPKRPH